MRYVERNIMRGWASNNGHRHKRYNGGAILPSSRCIVVVIITEKYFPPAIYPLAHMVEISRNDDSYYACHKCIISSLTVLAKNLALCPRNFEKKVLDRLTKDRYIPAIFYENAGMLPRKGEISRDFGLRKNPLKDANPGIEEEILIVAPAKRSENKLGNGIKILLVDDDLNTLTVLGDLLNQEGYDTVVAAHGKEALNKIGDEKPHVALVDTRLPGMDGYEVCRRIKQLPGLTTKVIIYTAFVDAVNVAKARKVGADDFIGKTEDFENMRRAIREVLGTGDC